MPVLSALRASLIALLALAGAAFMSAAYADSGSISFSVIKAGFVIGGSAAAVGRGAQAIVLTNQHGAVLTLSGNSVGAIVSADLNGLVVTVK